MGLEDTTFARTPYDPMVAYGRSKTANILCAVEFDRRHRTRGVCARHISADTLEQMLQQINAELAAEGQSPFQWKTIPQGATTSVWAGVIADADAVGGRYCENCHISAVSDGLINPISEGVRSYALDLERAKRSGSRARRWWVSASDPFLNRPPFGEAICGLKEVGEGSRAG